MKTINDLENLNNASIYGRNAKHKRMHISFRLTEQMEKELNEFANTYGISLSVLVRLAIQFYLKMNKQNKE